MKQAPPENCQPSDDHWKTVHVATERVSFGDEALFENLQFVLPGGRWTCVLGTSGVGKSTLLRLIAGLAQPEGQCLVRCGDGAPLAGRVAFMAQQDLLLPWLDLTDNVLLGPKLRGELDRSGRARHEARTLLDKVGLGADDSLLPSECSGGMRQRAALARTLIEDRPIVLMDEPFSALDAITRLHVQDLAASLLSGKTVLLVTHDPMEALRLGHHIHVMSERPAQLGLPITPDGDPPRDPADPVLQARHREILDRLTAAGGAP